MQIIYENCLWPLAFPCGQRLLALGSSKNFVSRKFMPKKENTNAIIIYINTITHDYTVPPLARYHREHSYATSCLSSCINSVDKKIINRLHAITHDWHLPRSCFLPPGKTVGTPWQRGLLRANSAKGIRTDNVHVICFDGRSY